MPSRRTLRRAGIGGAISIVCAAEVSAQSPSTPPPRLYLNDSQSGHPNGEIPAPATAIDRIEVMAGAGSAVHGADALGGVINIVTRRGAYTSASIAAGQHGYVDAQITSSGRGAGDWTFSGWGSRSEGFTVDRDHATGGASVRATPMRGLIVDARHQRRAFGANGFYGPSPSQEWTDQTLASIAWQREAGSWIIQVEGTARNHGDHFRWDIARPGFAENRHRTNAASMQVQATRSTRAGGRLTAGASAGGDWLASSNLGNRHYARGAVFAEWRQPLTEPASVSGGARLDGYSTFGRSTSPSAGVAVRVAPALRVRGAVAHAFRVPTFTELYCTDPSNLGTPDLCSERGWSLDGGLDRTPANWSGSFSIFRRWDRDVIDWVRESAAHRWRSNNMRDVTSSGFEASLGRRVGPASLRLFYAGLSVEAPALTLQSKYVLEYARHQSGGSLSSPLVLGLRGALNVDHRHRRDGQSYDLVAATLGRRVGRADLVASATNLLDETYTEIAGVSMPGRWLVAGLRLE